MAITPTRLAWGAVTTGTTTRYSTGNTGITLRSIILCNTTNAPINVSVAIAPSAGAVIPLLTTVGIPVGAPQTIDLEGGMALLAGDVFTDSASGAGVTIVLNAIVSS